MKLIHILSLVILFSSSVFAGGQLGSGGNGCTLRTGEWKSMEELIYPHIFDHDFNQFNKFEFEETTTSTFKRIKLSDYVDHSYAFRKLKAVSIAYPRTYRALMSMTKLFDSAYLIQKPVEGIFAGDLTLLNDHLCDSFSPALMTMNFGGVVFFAETWNQLSGQSIEVILIHEVLRLAQSLHPAFKNFDNWELQNVTALLFSHKSEEFIINKQLQRIENNLKYASFTELDISKQQSFSYRLKMEKYIKMYFLDQ